MTFRSDLGAEPFRFDFYQTMRELERSSPEKPRIGQSAMPAEDVVWLGQDPFLEFPASNLTEYKDTPAGVPRVQTRFLGFFGPQGALPLNTTIDAYNWSMHQDPSFARFTDIFANRFLQFFYRAWADAHPIAQHDRPRQDRFLRYVGTVSGIGGDAFAERDGVEDIAKIPFAGLAGSAVKSATRLRQLVRGVFGVDAEVEERIGSWLLFEPGDRMALGQSGSGLGTDAVLGSRAYSINEKVRIVIRTGTLEQYRQFLPSGGMADRLADLVFYYIGHRWEFDVQLLLPATLAPAVRLGQSGELGWTAWIAPSPPEDADACLGEARFDPMQRRRTAVPETKRRKPRGGAKR